MKLVTILYFYYIFHRPTIEGKGTGIGIEKEEDQSLQPEIMFVSY